jgi:hypothetical protein
MNRYLATSAALVGLSGALLAQTQTISVPLNYNFNGCVHAGENGNPDDPNGYRSISDRGLDWTNGTPGAWANYALVGQPGVVDCVHIGDRDQRWPFDPVANGNNRGTQPAWLPVSDQRNGQSTVLGTALTVDASTKAKFIYMISDGGGSFDVEFKFASGGSVVATLSAGDWFGGPFPGTDDFDNGNPGAAGLNIDEGTVDLSGSAGETVTEIVFGNASNLNAGYAIFGCNFEYTTVVPPSFTNRIALNYNFNGVVHTGEEEDPDNPDGYRSISDRGLNWQGGTPTATNGAFGEYLFVEQALVPDIVHVGDRDQRWPFDPTPDGDDRGIQPNWLPNPDQRGPPTTQLADLIRMDGSSAASVLLMVSDGGGSLDVEFSFTDGSTYVDTIGAGDWFGGPYPGSDSFDRGRTPGAAGLNIDERTIDLSGQAGKILQAVSFQNASNNNAGYAIFAMNVIGCVECASGALAQVNNLGGGTGPSISTSSNGSLGCDLDWTVSGGQPNAPGVWLLGAGVTSVPVSLIVPGCSGSVSTPSPILFNAALDANGEATFTLSFPALVNQALCGFQVTAQHATFAAPPCPSLSDALAITVGN